MRRLADRAGRFYARFPAPLRFVLRLLVMPVWLSLLAVAFALLAALLYVLDTRDTLGK